MVLIFQRGQKKGSLRGLPNSLFYFPDSFGYV
jgi:hypothetical protein